MIKIQTEPFDVGAEIARLYAQRPEVGAVASFLGIMRDKNEGAGVTEMFLEHYPAMTLKSLENLESQARRRWAVQDVSIIHRHGHLHPTDPIVLVAVSSEHRRDAFAACEFIMDYLKTQAPFWKRESTTDGKRWVAARASDTEAAERW